MRVLGIDPGLERVGWGVLDKAGSQLKVQGYGLIKTPKVAAQDRFLQIHEEVTAIIKKHRPERLAIEKLFFAKNQTTVMDVARASGVIILAAAQSGLEIHELSPPEIKKGVTGVGNADKKQVQFMITKILGLKETPKPDDVADALAIAAAHAMRPDFR
jgi:crossover junction endodeoxyribonuclease RuvC